MNITPDMLHQQLARADIGSREAARLLNLRQIHINERQFRHYLSGRSSCPDVVFRALRDLANEVKP